jgi:RNA polymerase primary sigma factor
LPHDSLILIFETFFRFGLSRERVRQVGLIAMEKLKHATRRKKLDALLQDY